MKTAVRDLARIGTVALLCTVVTVGLTGCFSNPLDGLVEGAIQDGIEKAMDEVADGALDGAIDNIQATATAELPEDFPTAVPLFATELADAGRVQEGSVTIWTVDFLGGGDIDAAGAQVRQQFGDAGFAEVLWSDGATVPGTISGMFDKRPLLVTTMVFERGGTVHVRYAITQDSDG